MPTYIIFRMSKKPLILRLYTEPHFYELASTVNYGGKNLASEILSAAALAGIACIGVAQRAAAQVPPSRN